MEYTVLIYHAEEGGFWAEVPTLPGCYSQGETIEETMSNIKELIEEKLKKAEEELKKSGQKAVSLTDPEARFMKNKKERIELSYNPQITADHDLGIIVANDVTQDCTDHHPSVATPG